MTSKLDQRISRRHVVNLQVACGELRRAGEALGVSCLMQWRPVSVRGVQASLAWLRALCLASLPTRIAGHYNRVAVNVDRQLSRNLTFAKFVPLAKLSSSCAHIRGIQAAVDVKLSFHHSVQKFYRVSKSLSAMGAPGGAVTDGTPIHPATHLEYFDDMHKLESEASVINLFVDGTRLAVVLDRSILYPQGGGQPADFGWIVSLDGRIRFRVEDVRSKGSVVHHYGSYENEGESPGSFSPGQEVALKVDSDRRLLHCRLHTAGHLIDSCMHAVGQTHLQPGKGHHFPDSPHVEYKGAVPAGQIEDIRLAVEVEANRRVTAGGSVEALITDYESAAGLCFHALPEFIEKDSRPRIVQVADFWCPCGGTHVKDLTEVGKLLVPQIRVKKGMTKVSYKLEVTN